MVDVREAIRVSRRYVFGPDSERGNIAVMFAVMLPIVVGGAAMGVETTYWYTARLNLQAAADAAAYSGAMDMRTGSNHNAVVATSTSTAVANGFDTTIGAIAVNTPPLTGSGGAQAVEVILETTAQRFFTSLFTDTPVNLKARAVAKWANAGDACILALNMTASKAALFSGSSATTLTGCSVMANSNASDALTVQGSATLSTKCLISGGGIAVNSGVTMTCPQSFSHASPIGDPLKDLAVPTPTGACLSDSGPTRAPGRYCAGMDLKNTVNLSPGVYYVSGGDFKVNANAVVTGTGVTIYLVSGSHVNLNGNSTTTLTAPTSGTHSGILFFGDRSGSGTNKFNGTAASSLTGTIYFPSQSVDYIGNFSGDGGCTQVIADTVGWSGNSNVSQDCSSKGMATIAALRLVALSE